MTQSVDLRLRLHELRERFDASFAARPSRVDTEHLELLAIGIADRRYFVMLDHIAGMYVDRPVTPVPSRFAHLLGIADFRGELVAVHDLGQLLGHRPAARPRYMVRAAEHAVAFAFEHFGGHVRRPRNLAVQSVLGLTALVRELERRSGYSSSEEA
ncbi:MAG: chemotaxis protein CheW [Polyangiales bacterium]